ncbi:MAG: putative quinol monooxygenase [Myxococcota bacterium]
MSKATMIPMQATPDNGVALRAFLKTGRDLVAKTEPATLSWFALSREGDANGVAIFDTFADQAGRDAHFGGVVAGALQAKSTELVDGGWDGVLSAVANYERIASLERAGAPQPGKATYITLTAAPGRADDLAAFLTGGCGLVEQTEPNTLTWYALRSETDPTQFAIFDLFANDAGRAEHFAGQVAAALKAESTALVSGGWESGVLANVHHFDVHAAV